MALAKDTIYNVYNGGIKDGTRMFKDFIGKDDLIDVALESLTPHDQKHVERASLPDLEKAVSNYLDGIEDGIKIALKSEGSKYVKWLRNAYK